MSEEGLQVEFDTQEESDKFLLAEAKLGIDAEDFLRSSVGQYLKARCEGSVRAFTSMALEATPDEKALAQAKVEAYGARMAMRFLLEAIVNGRNAEKQMQDRDASEIAAS